MVIFYFGADNSFKELQHTGYSRRNTIVLKTLSEKKDIEQLILFNYTSRKNFLKNFFQNFRYGKEKVKDVFFSEIFVLGKAKSVFFNHLFNRIYFWFLTIRYSKKKLLCWVYWPNGFTDFKKAGIKAPFLFDADHNLPDDPNLDANDKSELEILLKEVAKKASLIVSGSKSMLEWFDKNGSSAVYRLRNGIAPERFQQNTVIKLKKVTVVYCGVLSNWINYELFSIVVSSNPAVDFVIIGKAYVNSSYSNLAKYSNVFFWGEKNAGEVAALLPQFHAGICLYNTGVIDGDSMKLYEYLAAGLPVISTDYHPLLKEDFEGLLYIGDTAEDFNRIIAGLQNQSLVPDKKRTEAFLQNASWRRRTDMVLETFLKNHT